MLLLSAACMTSHGKLLPEQSFESRFLAGNRVVRVYLPPSYEMKPRRGYPVLYLHDGQNVFSSAGPHCCFGWGSWELDVTADALIRAGRMREIIMVSVSNSRSRYREYRGRLHRTAPKGKPAKSGATDEPDNTKFDAYAQFLIKELKPHIDRAYRTLKSARSTAVMGSSLGGICSLSLGWEYPKVFGQVASLSGSFQIERRNFLEQVLQPYRGRAKPVRIYLDSGTMDFTGDDDGLSDTTAVAAALRRIGWKDGKGLMHYTDQSTLTDEELERTSLPRQKWQEAQSSQHNEFYWKLRAWRALEFLFPNTP
jgi:predicted alpha/beta superfamily hydrolase